MKLLNWLFGSRHITAKRSAPVSRAQHVEARYDAAVTNEDNRRHWSNADALSADAVANPQIRRTLRNRARYEASNNSYLRGITETVANDTVGTGPRLQMLTDDEKFNQIVEKLWREWARAIGLDSKLRVMRAARIMSGEAFAVKTRNPGLRHPVKLDMFVYEPDQVGGGLQSPTDPLYYDGIKYDQSGNPLVYDFYKSHPGDTAATMILPNEFDPVAARDVWHYYRPERPGQRRGVPEATPALPLFAHIRSLELSVVKAMRTAAGYAMALESNASFDEDDTSAGTGGTVGDGGAVTPSAMDTIELQDNMTTVLPSGYKLAQTKPEHPHQKFNDVVDSLLREVGRCMNVPFEIAALDASKANMSAAYLNRQPYIKGIEVERCSLAGGLDWLAADWFWFLERADIPELAEYRGAFPGTQHTWFWDTIVEHADPDKVASAQETQLRSGTTSIPIEYAKGGQDAETALVSEAKFFKVPVEELRKRKYEKLYTQQPAAVTPPTNRKPNEDEDESEDAPAGAAGE